MRVLYKEPGCITSLGFERDFLLGLWHLSSARSIRSNPCCPKRVRTTAKCLSSSNSSKGPVLRTTSTFARNSGERLFRPKSPDGTCHASAAIQRLHRFNAPNRCHLLISRVRGRHTHSSYV